MNDIIPKNLQIADEFKGMGGQLGQGIASAFTSIGYKRQVWSLKQSGEAPKLFLHEVDGSMAPLPYLDCVILAENHKTSKVYFGGVYSDDAAAAPMCQSADGIKPDPGVPERQNPNCGDCRHNQWGSALNGGRGKACQDHRRLAIVLMPYMTKDMLEKPIEDPIFLKIPPGSLGSYKTYGDMLMSRGIPPFSVITRITFTPGKQFEMAFVVKQALTGKEAPRIKELVKDPLVNQIIGVTPVIREALPDIPAEGEPVQIIPPTRKGRSPGSPNKPKMVEPQQLEAFAEAEVAGEPQAAVAQDDDELDEAVKKIQQKKMQQMMPK
jgi:hypothetical protein